MAFLKQKKLYIFLFTGIIIAGETTTAFSRWANLNDAEMEIKSINQTIYIDNEGKSDHIYELQAKLLKEKSKFIWDKYTIFYNKNTTKAEILEAYTLVDNKKYFITTEKIVPKPISSNVQYSDKQTQLLIPYSNLKAGTIVYLKSKLTDLVPQFNEFYSAHFTFGHSFYTHSEKIHITSELPLHISTNDPNQLLNIHHTTKKHRNKKIYFLEINQDKPIYKNIVEENKIYFNFKNIPSISVAAMPIKTHYKKSIILGYNKIKNEPLPILYQEIAKSAQIQSNVIDKINTITSLLNANIKYQVNPKKSFFPKSLQEVCNSGQGDCKDLSLATYVILQSIGIPSKIASIKSSENNSSLSSNLPYQDTNHAIVKIELPDKDLWIDPTHPVSMANYISPHLANKKALILQDNDMTYENIPNINSNDYRLIKEEIWDMKNLPEISIKGNIKLLGIAAGSFIGRKNVFSEIEIKKMLLSSIIKNNHNILSHNITLPDLTSRIIKDLSFEYTLIVKPNDLTQIEDAIPVSFKSANLFISDKNAVSAIHLGPPRVYESNITLQNIPSFYKANDFNCDLKSKWVNLLRIVDYKANKNELFIHKKMEIKQSWIEDTELLSNTYQNLKSNIVKYLLTSQ